MALYNKFRPKTWAEIIGQQTVVSSLRKSIEKKTMHTYVLHGDPGVGKTTLARIAAKALGCERQSLKEIPAAVTTGVDDMRDLLRSVKTRPLYGDVRCIILDECHMLSKAAWNSILKATEEPANFVYWFLVTTELNKVPKTIQTRGLVFKLKPVPVEEIQERLQFIATEENLPIKSKLIELCAAEAMGSVRQAVSYLEACAYAKTREEAMELMEKSTESPKAIDLARLMLRRPKWKALQVVLSGMRDENPESVRHVVQAYMTNVILGAKSPDIAGAAMEVLDGFAEPFPSGQGIAPLVLACGRLTLTR